MVASVVYPHFPDIFASLRYLRQGKTKLNIMECMFFCLPQSRRFHVSEITNNNDKFNLSKQNRRKSKFRSSEKQNGMVTGKLQTFQLDSLPGDMTNSTTSIRQDALASTLQQAMTSLLQSSDVDPKLLDYHIEISRVRIAYDYNHVTFYWKSMDEEENSEDIQKLLQNNQNALRMMLPSYHHLHISPRVVFACDRQTQYLADVDMLLMKSRQQQGEE